MCVWLAGWLVRVAIRYNMVGSGVLITRRDGCCRRAVVSVTIPYFITYTTAPPPEEMRPLTGCVACCWDARLCDVWRTI